MTRRTAASASSCSRRTAKADGGSAGQENAGPGHQLGRERRRRGEGVYYTCTWRRGLGRIRPKQAFTAWGLTTASLPLHSLGRAPRHTSQLIRTEIWLYVTFQPLTSPVGNRPVELHVTPSPEIMYQAVIRSLAVASSSRHHSDGPYDSVSTTSPKSPPIHPEHA
jgi:hypothetical protein